MNESRARVGAGGMIRIPPDLLTTLRISEGDEVDLKAEVSKLVLIPVISRKRIKLSAEIVDELVENEDFFEAELACGTFQTAARYSLTPTDRGNDTCAVVY